MTDIALFFLPSYASILTQISCVVRFISVSITVVTSLMSSQCWHWTEGCSKPTMEDLPRMKL